MQSDERSIKSNRFSFDSQELVSQDGGIEIGDLGRLGKAKLLFSVV